MTERLFFQLPYRHPWVTRIGLAISLAVALGYAPKGLVRGAGADIQGLERRLADTRSAAQATAAENQTLRARVRALKNEPRAVEDVARRDLGWVRPGEVVVDLGTGAGFGAGDGQEAE